MRFSVKQIMEILKFCCLPGLGNKMQETCPLYVLHCAHRSRVMWLGWFSARRAIRNGRPPFGRTGTVAALTGRYRQSGGVVEDRAVATWLARGTGRTAQSRVPNVSGAAHMHVLFCFSCCRGNNKTPRRRRRPPFLPAFSSKINK